MSDIHEIRTATYTLTNVWSTGTDADTSDYDVCSYVVPPGLQIDGLGRAQQRAFGPPGTPALDFTLPNYDGRYSPGGTLGKFVGRGPVSVVDANYGSDILGDSDAVMGDAHDILGDGRFQKRLFTGAIDTAEQDIDQATASVHVRSLGRISLLTEKNPLLPLSENISTDVAITQILDAIEWPAEDRLIDSGDTDLLYFWADGQQSAMALINLILGAEGVPSCAYEDGDGIFHFEGRQYRALAPRSLTPQRYLLDGARGTGQITGDDAYTLGDDEETFGDGALEGIAFHIVPARWAANPDEVVKDVKAEVNVRQATATMKIWEYGGPLVLSASQSIDLEVTSSDPFKSAVVPVLNTDYAVIGTALASVTLLETSGQRARIRLVAGSGTATVLGVTSNGIQLRAVSLPTIATVPVTSTVNTVLASARYRPKDHSIPLWPEIAVNRALDLVNNFARRYQAPRDQLTIRVANIDAKSLYAMLMMKISDLVFILHTHGRIAGTYFIEQIHHDLSIGGGVHVMTIGCERSTQDVPARFGEARFGFDHFSE